ncbi:hypothetical protein DQ04_08431060, partial [Trypanosoma grayi]|uniref:hypothetical protein n=1 Tax=Trypanosoma grayi TaxID=71804 RepID=UPI0004F42FAC
MSIVCFFSHRFLSVLRCFRSVVCAKGAWMTGAVVVLLRDSYSALALLLEVRRHRRDAHLRSEIADYVLLSLPAEATVPLVDAACRPAALRLVSIGVSPHAGLLCLVAL